jgi:hypothetical protein
MAVGGIVIGQGQIYTSNPCAEIALGPIEPKEKICISPSYDGDGLTIPTCIECGCPDLIDTDPALWECMSCGHKHFSAVLSTPEVAQEWRPASRYGIIDWFLEPG